MATVYKSKIDTWMIVVVVSAIVISLYACAVVIFSSLSNMIWTLLFTLGLGVGLPIWILVSTRYTLDSKQLIIRSGPFNWSVPISEISNIAPTNSILSSPALSLDRLRIDYGQGRKIMISPRDKEFFLQEIETLRRG